MAYMKNRCLNVSIVSNNGFGSYLCYLWKVDKLPNRESFSSPKFQLDRNLESYKLYCMMNENFHL